MIIPNDAKDIMNQENVIALATASKDAVPNVAYMMRYWWYEPDTLVIGDSFMIATKNNVMENPQVSFCVWDDKKNKSYKFMGTATYETSGDAFDFATEEMHKTKPNKNFKGVMLIKVTSVYDVYPGENAGKLIAE